MQKVEIISKNDKPYLRRYIIKKDKIIPFDTFLNDEMSDALIIDGKLKTGQDLNEAINGPLFYKAPIIKSNINKIYDDYITVRDKTEQYNTILQDPNIVKNINNLGVNKKIDSLSEKIDSLIVKKITVNNDEINDILKDNHDLIMEYTMQDGLVIPSDKNKLIRQSLIETIEKTTGKRLIPSTISKKIIRYRKNIKTSDDLENLDQMYNIKEKEGMGVNDYLNKYIKT